VPDRRGTRHDVYDIIIVIIISLVPGKIVYIYIYTIDIREELLEPLEPTSISVLVFRIFVIGRRRDHRRIVRLHVYRTGPNLEIFVFSMGRREAAGH